MIVSGFRRFDSAVPRLLWCLAGAALVLSVSCTDGSPTRPDPAGQASPPAFTNGGDCPPAPELAADAGCVTRARADANGDGAVDDFAVYARLSRRARPRFWVMRLDTGSDAITEPLDAGNAFSYPRVIGGADIDGDGAAEMFVKAYDLTSHGAPWQTLYVVRYLGGRLRVVEFEQGPLTVNVGGIARLGEGARCSAGTLVLLRAEAVNRRNTVWRYSERILAIDGTRAQLVERREGRLSLTDYNDPALDPYYRLDCGTLMHP